MSSWLKAELHSHTADDPEDGGRIVLHSAEALIDRAAEQGFQVLAITNHNHLSHSKRLEQFAARRGILLIPGVEATIERRHLLLYNFTDYEASWKRFEEVKSRKRPDRLVVAPHPFFPSPSAVGSMFLPWRHFIDALEFNHFYCSWLNFNRRAVKFSRTLGIPLIGNSDVHRLNQLGRTYSLIEAEQEVDSVLSAVRDGRVQIFSRPLSPLFILSWFGLNAWMRTRYVLRSGGSLLESMKGTASARPIEKGGSRG